jgi:acetyltransferase-like isoleucine patch superfamily enzyme
MLIKIINYLKDFRAKKRVVGNINIAISTTAKISRFGKIIIPHDQSRLSIGNDSIIEGSIYLEHPESQVTIGERTFIGAGMINCAKNITIKDDVLIAWGCTIMDHNSHSLSWSRRAQDVPNIIMGKVKNWEYVERGVISILSKVWIGCNVHIMSNVTIGEGAVVGSGSVVTKDVAAWTVVAGNPAKVIRHITESER